MAESRDWKMVEDRRGNDDMVSGIADDDITARVDEEDDEEFEDTEDDLDEDEEDVDESER